MGSLLLFIESAGPGGAERVVHKLALALRARGHRVGVATLRTGWLTERLAADGVPHHLLSSTRRLDLGFPLQLSRLLKQHSYSVLHSHLLDSNFYGALAARFAGRRHVATEHGDVHHLQPKKLLGLKIRTISACGSTIAAVSGFSRGKLLERGANPRRVVVIGNPIDPVTPDPRARITERASLGLPPDAHEHFVWVHVANLRPVKDQETLLKGFAAARATIERPQTLLIVGDGELRPGLEALAESLGIRSAVRFLGFSDAVERPLQAGDGFVLTSRSEALPMSLLEAGVFGLTPVVSAVGGLPEVVVDGQTGRTFPAGDAASLGAALAAVAGDLEQCRMLQRGLASVIRERFETPAVIAAYEKLYGFTE